MGREGTGSIFIQDEKYLRSGVRDHLLCLGQILTSINIPGGKGDQGEIT